MKRKISQAAAWKLVFEELGEIGLKLTPTGIWTDSYKEKEKKLLLSFSDGNNSKRILNYLVSTAKSEELASREALHDMQKDLDEELARAVKHRQRSARLATLANSFEDLDSEDVEGG